MADFDKVRFPAKVSLNAVGGPGFLTAVDIMSNSAEARVQEWANERGEWTVSFSSSLPSEWQPLLAFFRCIAKGMANTFRFKDWTDFECANGDGFFVDDDTLSPPGKQMVKRYNFPGLDGSPNYYYRTISKPIEGKVTTDATGLDYSTGIADAGTTWYGEFDCWCRLNSDVQKLQMIDRNLGKGLIMGWNGIELVEVIHEELDGSP